MDKLKQFIDQHIGEFREEALPEGHLERFGKKLPPSPAKKRKLLIGVCSFAAAATLALLLWVRPSFVMDDSGETVCESAQEIREVRLYYQMRIDEVIAQMQTIYKEKKAPGTADLWQETNRVLSETERFESDILPKLPCSNDGLYAMNQHYSNSLESLMIMLQQMERVTNEYTNYK